MNALAPWCVEREDRYREFFHPVPLAALVVLLLNDHWFKGAGVLPPVLTGKLSDFAGLLYFPLFLTAASRWSASFLRLVVPWCAPWIERRLQLSPALLFGACLTTGVGFAALKLHRPFAELYLDALACVGQRAAVTPDPTDLWALVCLPLAFWIGLQAMESAAPGSDATRPPGQRRTLWVRRCRLAKVSSPS